MTDAGVLLVSPWFAEPGGVTTVVRQQARYLMAAGDAPVLLLPNGRDARVPHGGPDVEVLCVEIPSPVVQGHPVRSRLGFVVHFPVALIRLALLLRRRHIHTVNVHVPASHHIVFLALKRVLRLRLVISAHGTDLLPGGGAPARYPASLFRVLKGADAIIVPSADFRRRLVSALPVLDRTLHVVPHGVAVLGDEVLLGAPDLPEQFVACTGALRRVKGQDVLVRAWAEVVKLLPAWHLVLVGEGPLRPDLEVLVRDLSLEGRVHLLGELDHARALSVMYRARLVAVPSRMESFGLAALEAMALGKAVVASRVGGLPEVVRDGDTGVLVPSDSPSELAHALITLIKAPESSERLGHMGQRVAREQFSQERVGADWRRVLLGR